MKDSKEKNKNTNKYTVYTKGYADPFDYNDPKENSQPDKIPIYRGCANTQCFCTGSCKEIIGYRDRQFGE